MNLFSAENPAFQNFFEMLVSIRHADFRKSFPTLEQDTFSIQTGRRYIKINLHSSNGQTFVHAFVDRTNGDVLKPATFKAPAKHARGNIFAEDNGRSAITAQGTIRYMD